MKQFKLKLFLSLLSATMLNAYEIDDPTLGNIAIEAGVWSTKLDGNIKNTVSTTNFKDDLGFDEKKNVTSFGLDLKNDYSWLPNIYVNYFTLNSSTDGNMATAKQINNTYTNFEFSYQCPTTMADECKPVEPSGSKREAA